MAALARQIDAKAIGGKQHQPTKQNPHRKLRTVRKNLTEHVYESQFEWTDSERSSIRSFLTDLAQGTESYQGLQLAEQPLSKVITPKHKPSARTKPVAKAVVKPKAKVAETTKPVIQSTNQSVNNVSVEGFIGLIQSDNVRQAKSYIQYAADDFDNRFTRSSIKRCEQDWIRPYVDELAALCSKLEPMQEAPKVERDQDDPPVFVHLSQTIESVIVKGKSRRKSKQKVRVEMQRTQQYDAWLERNTPITNRKGEPLCCELIGFDTPTKVMTVSTPTPVMIGDIQVGVRHSSEVVRVPCAVSDSVATAYKWANIDSKLSKWGSSYVDPSDKLCDQVVSNFVHRWNDKAPTLPAFGKGSDNKESVSADLPSTEAVNTDTVFDYTDVLKDLHSPRQNMIRSVYAKSLELANSTHKPAEPNLQDDVASYNSVDVSGVPWDNNDSDTVQVVNNDSGAALETNSSDAYIIAGLAEYLNKLPIWQRVEAKIQISDREEFLKKYAIAQDMERIRESADEIARLDAWLHSRESETAVMSDYIRYDEWCEEHLQADQAGALQVHLMDMERRRPSFTLDSGEKCYTCKRTHFKHFLQGLKATSDAQFIGPKITGEAVVTPPVVSGKAGVTSAPTSMTNPLRCNARLNLPDKESEDSILRKLILDQDEIPEKFQRLTSELKKDVVNFNIVKELTKLYVKSDTGILVPC